MSTQKENTTQLPHGKRKRRSLLKPTKPLEQELQNFTERSQKDKRVSFSNTVHIKEFQSELPTQSHVKAAGCTNDSHQGDIKQVEIPDDSTSFIQISTPLAKKRRRISAQSGIRIERLSIIPHEMTFIEEDEEFDVLTNDLEHVPVSTAAHKEDTIPTEVADFEAYTDDADFNEPSKVMDMSLHNSAQLMDDLVSGSSVSDAMDITCNESKQAEPDAPTNTLQVQPTLAADFFKQISTANAERQVSQPAECIDAAVTGSRSTNVSTVINASDGCMSLSLTCIDKESSCDHLNHTLCSHEDTSPPNLPSQPRLVEASSPSHPQTDNDGSMLLSFTCMDQKSPPSSGQNYSLEDTSLLEVSPQPRMVRASSPEGIGNGSDGCMPLSFTCMYQESPSSSDLNHCLEDTRPGLLVSSQPQVFEDGSPTHPGSNNSRCTHMDHHSSSSNAQNHTLYTNQDTDLQNCSQQLKVFSGSSLSKAQADDGAQCTVTTEKIESTHTCSIEKKPQAAHDQSRTEHSTNEPVTAGHSVACNPSEQCLLQHKMPLFPYKFHSRTSTMARSVPIGNLSQFRVPQPPHSSLAVSSLLSSKSPSLTHLLVSKKEATKVTLPFQPQPKECDMPRSHTSGEVLSSSQMSTVGSLQAPVSPSSVCKNTTEDHPHAFLNKSDQPDSTELHPHSYNWLQTSCDESLPLIEQSSQSNCSNTIVEDSNGSTSQQLHPMIRDQKSLILTSTATNDLIDGEFCNVLHSPLCKQQAEPESESASCETASVHQSVASDSSMPITCISAHLMFDHHIESEEFYHSSKSDDSLLTQSEKAVLTDEYQESSLCMDFTLSNESENRDFGSLLLGLKERLDIAVALFEQRLCRSEYHAGDTVIKTTLEKCLNTVVLYCNSLEVLMEFRVLCGDTVGNRRYTTELPSPPMGGPDFSGSKLQKARWIHDVMEVLHYLFELTEDLLEQAGRYYGWNLVSWSSDRIKFCLYSKLVLMLHLEPNKGCDQTVTTIDISKTEDLTLSDELTDIIATCKKCSGIAQMLWHLSQKNL